MEEGRSRYKMDKLLQLHPFRCSKPNHVWLTTALKKLYKDIHEELSHFCRKEEFQSNESLNNILNDMILKSLPAVLSNQIKRRHRDERILLNIAFRILRKRHA
jgi:hypothetical protein